MPEHTSDPNTSSTDKVLVIIPTYNEAENIELITNRLRTAVPDAHVLIADDNSPDGTGRIVDTMVAADDHVHVLHRRGKQGLGAAYLAGFEWGMDHGYTVLVEHDADGSHQPEDLPRLLAKIDEADLVIGSRYVPGGKVVNWPAYRQAISRGGSIWTKLMLGLKQKDVTGGFRAFRSTALEAIGLDEVASAGYCFQVDLLWRTVRAGLRVVEVPITFIERERGNSKMSKAIFIEALIRTTLWGIAHRAEQLRDAGEKALDQGVRKQKSST
ncbi:polyprenol monophosphomannose synthase [Propionibacteriaceae bacterium Y1700]|uniref:polyprenol monophosphomannose synthase n=1 Tax=Microlunatus sp. Y1700 TaxID=3418487 RepID=UPI003DA763C6